jgi:hypothetical protein
MIKLKIPTYNEKTWTYRIYQYVFLDGMVAWVWPKKLIEFFFCLPNIFNLFFI